MSSENPWQYTPPVPGAAPGYTLGTDRVSAPLAPPPSRAGRWAAVVLSGLAGLVVGSLLTALVLAPGEDEPAQDALAGDVPFAEEPDSEPGGFSDMDVSEWAPLGSPEQEYTAGDFLIRDVQTRCNYGVFEARGRVTNNGPAVEGVDIQLTTFDDSGSLAIAADESLFGLAAGATVTAEFSSQDPCAVPENVEFQATGIF